MPKAASKQHVRLPRTANSYGLSFAILIHRIRPHRTMMDVFEGRRFRPGATVTEKELWPTPGHPAVPLLLEYAGSDRSGSGHKRSQHIYLLWQYKDGEWRELARTAAESVEWLEVLRPIAIRHLTGATDCEMARQAAADATSRVLTALENELETLGTNERRSFLGLLYEQFTARLVRDGVTETGSL